MCWSWQVSLGFAIVQFIELGYLFLRNEYIDRYWVLLLSPIMIQEFCQFVVWKYGITEDTTIHQCNNVNYICSRIIVAFTLSLPVLTSYFVLETINHVTIKRWIEIYWKCLLFIGTMLYLILVIFEMTDENFCIFVGSNGHLDWEETIRSDLPNYISQELYIFVTVTNYLLPIISSIFLFEPRWITFIPMTYISVTFAILYIMLGSESYSVWCWSGSFLLLWALLYLPFGSWLLSKYKEKYVNETDNILIKFFLKGAHQHWRRYQTYNRSQRISTDDGSDVDDIIDAVEPNQNVAIVALKDF